MKGFVKICFLIIFIGLALRTCNHVFVCHKASYAEGISIQIEKPPKDSIWFNVEAVQGKRSWELIDLDSNNLFRIMYYEETLASYDVPSMDDFMARSVRIRTTNDTIEVLPKLVTYTDTGYLLILPGIRIQHLHGGKTVFFVDGLLGEQYSKTIFQNRLFRVLKIALIIAIMCFALIAVFKIYIECNWYLVALKKIQGREDPDLMQRNISFTQFEEDSLQKARNILESEVILKGLFYARIRRSILCRVNQTQR